MDISTFSRVTTTIRLDNHEQWVETTKGDNKFEFFVARITWEGNDKVGLSGPGRRKSDNQRAYVDRSSWARFDDMPPNIRVALAESRRAAVLRLYHDDKKGPLS